MYYSLNASKGVDLGDYIGTTIGASKGDTRSVDYSSYNPIYLCSCGFAHVA